jgi:hypothetical protein
MLNPQSTIVVDPSTITIFSDGILAMISEQPLESHGEGENSASSLSITTATFSTHDPE